MKSQHLSKGEGAEANFTNVKHFIWDPKKSISRNYERLLKKWAEACLTNLQQMHPSHYHVSCQPAFFGPTIYVAQFLPSHFSPTIYVKLFALSSLRPTLIPYVNVACSHCPACAAMLMMQVQEVTSSTRLIVRLKKTWSGPKTSYETSPIVNM